MTLFFFPQDILLFFAVLCFIQAISFILPVIEAILADFNFLHKKPRVFCFFLLKSAIIGLHHEKGEK